MSKNLGDMLLRRTENIAKMQEAAKKTGQEIKQEKTQEPVFKYNPNRR